MSKFFQKVFFHSPGIKANADSGITLILAVIILSAISAISFSLGALVLREIQQSRQMLYSEPVIVSAEAGAEDELFFQIRKIVSSAVVCPNARVETLASGARFSTCNMMYDNPYMFDTSSANNEVVLLQDPLDPSNIAAGYSSVTVNATSSTGSVVTMKIEVYDLETMGDISPQTATVQTDNGGSSTATFNLLPTKSYSVFLIPIGSGTASGRITGRDGSGLVKGIPAKNPAVLSTSQRQELIRKLKIILGR